MTTGYFRFTSNGVRLQSDGYQSLDEYNRQNPPRRPKWQELEESMLENSRRDATRGERSAAESALWEQVAGRPLPQANTSPQFQRNYGTFLANLPRPSQKEISLEDKLFREIKETFGKVTTYELLDHVK